MKQAARVLFASKSSVSWFSVFSSAMMGMLVLYSLSSSTFWLSWPKRF